MLPQNQRDPAAAPEVQHGRFETVPVGDLIVDPANPRVHTRGQLDALASSIKSFGFNAPILVRSGGLVVAGHGRLAAAKLLGLSEVPVIRLDHLSDRQAQAYMLADNRLTERSTWDDAKVAAALRELSTIALDFELEATGFETAEIDLRIQSLQPAEITEPDETSIVEEGPTVSRMGDLWSLGVHRLLCGDAREQATYATLLGAERAATMATDPPYGVKIQGHVSGNGRRKHREFPMASGEMNSEEFSSFLRAFMVTSTAFLDPGATNFIFMDWRHMKEISCALDAAGHELLNLCVWAKTNGGMGSLYRSQHELVFVTGKPGEKRRNNVQLGKHGRYRTNLWTYPGMNSFPRRGQVKGLELHPTTKPVALIADAILDVTGREDIVLDPFCGSGTLFVAAEQTGRRGRGIELDPTYVDLAIGRWQRFTGKTAVHASGKTFEEVAANRGAANAGQ